MRTVSILGAGRLGGAIALALDNAGFVIENLIYRGSVPPQAQTDLYKRRPQIVNFGELETISSEIVFITTQDSGIEPAAVQLSEVVVASPVVYITSGALASTSISYLKDRGCKVGSMHPLVSISDPVWGARRFKNAFFCLEGDPEAVAVGESLVQALEGHSFSVPTDKKPLYHAAAVTSSGHLVALIDMAIGMLEKCGLNRGEAKKILLPLIESTLENLKEQGLARSLTGTFARGDAETFARHLDALKRHASHDEIETFLDLGSRSIEIARRIGIIGERLEELRERVLMAQRELR